MLAFQAVSKSFNSLMAVDDVSFELAEGEALGIIGPNGAGKTTVFNLIAGSMKPTSGTIRFEGRDIGGDSPAARCRSGIGRTHQIPHPFSGMTVFENTVVGAVFGGGQRERNSYGLCAEILRRVGLSDKANVVAGSLTLLDRKRLELARALATQPKLLLLDEIAGGLTDAEVRQLVDIINAIRASGVSIIWIEHIVHALMSVIDRLLAMDSGRELCQGPPAEVMARPDVQQVYLGIGTAA